MDMSSYAVEGVSPSVTQHDARTQYADWQPSLKLATQQHLVTLMENYPTLPASLVNADAELFLQKMYAYRR
jgi:hypothetical protein